jgi:hypothetical protein
MCAEQMPPRYPGSVTNVWHPVLQFGVLAKGRSGASLVSLRT